MFAPSQFIFMRGPLFDEETSSFLIINFCLALLWSPLLVVSVRLFRETVFTLFKLVKVCLFISFFKSMMNCWRRFANSNFILDRFMHFTHWPFVVLYTFIHWICSVIENILSYYSFIHSIIFLIFLVQILMHWIRIITWFYTLKLRRFIIWSLMQG